VMDDDPGAFVGAVIGVIFSFMLGFLLLLALTKAYMETLAK